MSSKAFEKYLQPGCDNFYQKLALFCITENWLDRGLQDDQQKFADDSFCLVKDRYKIQYYHTLFHLLSCPFCVDAADDILARRSHPELWRLVEQHPGLYIDIVYKTKQQTTIPQSYYFQLLYNNLVVTNSYGILLRRISATETNESIVSGRAAGVAEDLPSKVPISIFSTDVSLHFEWDPVSKELNIGLKGGTPKMRKNINLKIYYHWGDCDEFLGEDIAIGGMWSLEMEKGKNICRVDIRYL